MTASAAGQGITRQIWSPPGMDDKYVTAWRKAFSAIMADPKYIKEHSKSWGVPASWISGDIGEGIVKKFLDLSRPGEN
jgi:tripartite-type tricarboxylate transporter receptor subunit TctC